VCVGCGKGGFSRFVLWDYAPAYGSAVRSLCERGLDAGLKPPLYLRGKCNWGSRIAGPRKSVALRAKYRDSSTPLRSGRNDDS
jgi:hypothetical protein